MKAFLLLSLSFGAPTLLRCLPFFDPLFETSNGRKLLYRAQWKDFTSKSRRTIMVKEKRVGYSDHAILYSQA